MHTQSTIRSLLDASGLRPNKKFGQHFLIDGNLMRKLVASAEIEPKDVVLEVGCGTGSLTEELAEQADAVVAVEADSGMFEIASAQLAARKNVTLIHCDALQSKTQIAPRVLDALGDAKRRLGGRILLVANLPYQIASPLIIDLLIDVAEVERMCVTVQKEVGDRLLAGAGGKDYGPLSVIVQALAEARRIAPVPHQAFWPAPLVESAMIRIEPSPRRREEIGQIAHFTDVVKAAFVHRRKTLGRTLSGKYGPTVADRALSAIHVDPRTRPEQLGPETWIALADELAGA